MSGSTELRFNRGKEKRKIKLLFLAYNVGIFLCYSTYVSLINLQSSINVEDGLGTVTFAVSYAFSGFFAMFFVPVLVRKFGAKFWLIAGDISMFPFVIVNAFPSYYTLLPATIILAVFESAMWPSMSMINVFYASQYSGLSRKKKQSNLTLFSGYFFVAYQCAQVFGNMVSYIVLYGFDRIPIPTYSENCTDHSTTVENDTCFDLKDISCGADDCQNSTDISEHMDNYVPVNRISFYVLLGVMLCLEIIAVLIHFFFVPRDKVFRKEIKRCEDMGLNNDNKSDTVELCNNELLGRDDQDTNETNSEDGFLGLFKATFYHFTNLKTILLMPLTFYNGLSISYAMFELTRAFTSCTLGVQWIGICMALYGVTDALLSWVAGKYSRKIGHKLTYLIAAVVECVNYIYCLYWSPGPNVLLSVLLIYFLFGCTDGILQTMLNVTYIHFFKKDQDVALNVWNVMILFGFAFGCGISIVQCVRSRIYLNLTVLIIGYISLAIADVLHRREKANRKNGENGEVKT